MRQRGTVMALLATLAALGGAAVMATRACAPPRLAESPAVDDESRRSPVPFRSGELPRQDRPPIGRFTDGQGVLPPESIRQPRQPVAHLPGPDGGAAQAPDAGLAAPAQPLHPDVSLASPDAEVARLAGVDTAKAQTPPFLWPMGEWFAVLPGAGPQAQTPDYVGVTRRSTPGISAAPSLSDTALPAVAAAPPGLAATFPPCLGMPPGLRVASTSVSAESAEPIQVALPQAGDWYVVTSGTFHYSTPGYADAMRRWYQPPREVDPLCVTCNYDPMEASYAFLINGLPRRPLRACTFEHVYVHRVHAESVWLELLIADSKLGGGAYADNQGSLNVQVFSVPPEHPDPDRPGFRSGIAVGPELGSTSLGTNFFLSFQFGVLLHDQAEPVELPLGVTEVIADVYGLAARQGTEVDYGQFYDHVLRISGPGAPPLVFPCASATVLVGGEQPHRYLLLLKGCSNSVQPKALAEDWVGRFEVKLFGLPGK